MNRDLYPVDWAELAHEIKDANHWQCGECHLQCRRPGEFWLGWWYELTVSHYDREYDVEAVFVVPLCRKCHFLHDAAHSWRARRRNAGQLSMDFGR